MSIHSKVRKVTTHVLNEMKLKGEKIAMLTAYDYSLARIIDQSGVDIILVGEMRDFETIETALTLMKPHCQLPLII